MEDARWDYNYSIKLSSPRRNCRPYPELAFARNIDACHDTAVLLIGDAAAINGAYSVDNPTLGISGQLLALPDVGRAIAAKAPCLDDANICLLYSLYRC